MRLVFFSLVVLGTLASADPSIKPYGNARDIFLSANGMATCTLSVDLLARSPDVQAPKRLLRGVSRLLSAPQFADRFEALMPGPLTLQVGTINYDAGARFRLVANRPCGDDLNRAIAEVVTKSLLEKEFTVTLREWPGPSIANPLSDLTSLSEMKPGEFFRLYQPEFGPSKCLVGLKSQEFAKFDNRDVAIELTRGSDSVSSSFRFAVFGAIVKNDTVYILFYDYCNDVLRGAKAYLLGARLMGLQVPRRFEVFRPSLSDADVDAMFALGGVWTD